MNVNAQGGGRKFLGHFKHHFGSQMILRKGAHRYLETRSRSNIHGAYALIRKDTNVIKLTFCGINFRPLDIV